MLDLPAVTAAEALRESAAGTVLLDVREPLEWDAGHAPDAVHVPLASLRGAELPLEPGGRVLVVCRSGHRSMSATAFLRQLGLDAVNVDGGMHAWQQAGGAVVMNDGASGFVA
jgi:rhodanese-related sulfurtransferase